MCNSFKNTKVIDKRTTHKGRIIRRRRECLICGERFSTYEFYVQLGSGMYTNKLVKKDILEYLNGLL